MTDPADLSWLRIATAFSVVTALMLGLGYALKFISAYGGLLPFKDNHSRRLGVVESIALDAKRRAIILRCDEREHLLLLGAQDDIVIESNLPPSKPAQSP